MCMKLRGTKYLHKFSLGMVNMKVAFSSNLKPEHTELTPSRCVSFFFQIKATIKLWNEGIIFLHFVN